MLDIPPATVARAIGILRSGPLTAAQFAQRMWPERSTNRTPGEQSRSGHALLRQLAQVGYVQKVGDLWTLRVAGTAVGLGDSAVPTAVQTAVGLGGGPAVGLPVGPAVGLPVGPPVPPPLGLPFEEPDPAAERQRLHRLVALATEPVPTVTHDAVLGDIAIRDWPLDDFLAQACAWVVLRGRSANIYPPGENAEMFVGLTPVEAARALYLRWRQSGRPPELLDEYAWLFADDGLIASPAAWMPPEYDDYDTWFCDMFRFTGTEQIRRQREQAGLA